MVIVYNPASGATISDKFKGGGFGLAKALEPNSLQYCEPALAEALIATYPFLKIVPADEAELIKKAKEKPVEEPKQIEKKEKIVPGLSVVEAKKIEEVKQEPKTDEIPDDLKGVGWYGEGVKEENGSAA